MKIQRFLFRPRAQSFVVQRLLECPFVDPVSPCQSQKVGAMIAAAPQKNMAPTLTCCVVPRDCATVTTTKYSANVFLHFIYAMPCADGQRHGYWYCFVP
jgi:hypothetical protein